jgi:hypothetical protein
MEAGDCEGRLPPLFFGLDFGLWLLVFDLSGGMLDSISVDAFEK